MTELGGTGTATRVPTPRAQQVSLEATAHYHLRPTHRYAWRFAGNQDGAITVDEIITAVTAALHGCGGG